jgi:hypothetical protein
MYIFGRWQQFTLNSAVYAFHKFCAFRSCLRQLLHTVCHVARMLPFSTIAISVRVLPLASLRTVDDDIARSPLDTSAIGYAQVDPYSYS